MFSAQLFLAWSSPVSSTLILSDLKGTGQHSWRTALPQQQHRSCGTSHSSKYSREKTTVAYKDETATIKELGALLSACSSWSPFGVTIMVKGAPQLTQGIPTEEKQIFGFFHSRIAVLASTWNMGFGESVNHVCFTDFHSSGHFFKISLVGFITVNPRWIRDSRSKKYCFIQLVFFHFHFQFSKYSSTVRSMKNDNTFAHLGMKDDNKEDDNLFSSNEYYAFFFFLQRTPKETINPLHWSAFVCLSLFILREHWMMKYLMVVCISSQHVVPEQTCVRT